MIALCPGGVKGKCRGNLKKFSPVRSLDGAQGSVVRLLRVSRLLDECHMASDNLECHGLVAVAVALDVDRDW